MNNDQYANFICQWIAFHPFQFRDDAPWNLPMLKFPRFFALSERKQLLPKVPGGEDSFQNSIHSRFEEMYQ